MTLFARATSLPWLITEDGLRTVLDIASRETLDPDLARQIREDREARPSAVAARAGKPLDGAERVSVRDGVALLPVVGPIVRRGGLFADVSGASSISRLATDFHTALADPSVRAILLVVDSPGGEANGVNEFAQMVYAARGQKPITAYIEGMGASAAYWIASAADDVVVDAIAVVGSIGAVRTMPSPQGGAARTIEIVSSQSPNKRPDVATERGRQQIQDQVDALADVFVAAVARNRNVSTDTVLADFGQGGLFIGQAAIDVGLADALGSFEQTLADLAQRITPSPYGRPRGMAAQETEPMDFKAFWKGMFQAAAEVEGAPIAAHLETTAENAGDISSVDPVVAAERDAALTELAQLRAHQAQTAQAQIDAAATAFAEAQIASGAFEPGVRADLVALHTAAAAANCTAALAVVLAARPASASVELLPANVDVKPADRGAGDTAAQRAQADSLMAQTPLGQAALARRR